MQGKGTKQTTPTAYWCLRHVASCLSKSLRLAQLFLLHMHSPWVYCALGTVPGDKKDQVPDLKPLRVTAAPMFCPFLYSFLGHLGK